jgi:hypothetical protein
MITKKKYKLLEKDRIVYVGSNGKLGKAQVQRVFECDSGTVAIEAWCSYTGNMLLLFEDSNEVVLEKHYNE